jgi:two-component system, cell cycle sensor histidine kinase and response regulator CckA
MTTPLRVLVIEDFEDDMLLMLRELRRGGYTLEHLRVETPAEMESALDRQDWDIVIADYTLPLFSAPAALKLLQQKQRDLPFIIVSGTIGEETAVTAMKAGANDYIIKGQLTRLLPAVERELREAKERRKRQAAELALQESEAALRQSQQQYQALAEASPVGIFRTDAQSNCIYVNRQWSEMTGIPFESALQDGWARALHPEDHDRILMAWQTAFQHAAPFRLEFRFQKPDGTIVWVLGQALPEGGSEGLGYIGTVTDITEKKQMEAQFLRTQRLESLGTLASGIAHDFNNILTPILAISQLLPMKMPDLDARDQNLLDILEDSARRGADLVKQILVFARGSEGKRLPLQMNQILSDVRQMAQQTFPKAIEIQLHLPDDDLWTVSADSTQLHQVLMNLAVNARDAMPNGGCLTFSAQNILLDETFARMNLGAQAGAYVMITVADTGTGIAPELLERIFDPFFTTKEVGKGTGLGLSTTLGIVKTHGGFVKVQSVVGQGSQFKVYLPTLQENVAQPAASPRLLGGNNELILIVEDEPAIQQVTKASLEDCNYRTLTASDGIRAISLYAEYRQEISLVLMDIMMPSLDGVSAIRGLIDINPKVRVIAMSGLATNRQVTETLGTNVRAFLSKPYTMQELLNTLHEVLSEHSNITFHPGQTTAELPQSPSE